jgi:putative copper resistance protein D
VDAAVILARLVQYLAASAVGGSSLFFLYGWAPDRTAGWPIRMVRLASLLGALATLGWLMLKSAELGDGPADAFKAGALWAVASGAGFGRAALVRLGLFAVAFGLALRRSAGARWLGLAVLGLAATATFAWTGHGAADDGLAGVLHLCADVLHLWAAAIWIGALFGLAGLLVRRGRGAGPPESRIAADALNAFSRIGVAVVAVIVGSGLINSWYLVGLQGVGSLLSTTYGQLLAIKLLLFVSMLGLAAMNRYRHTPRLEAVAAGDPAGATALWSVTRSLVIETSAGVAVLLLVAWLGTLAPPAHG